MLQQPWQRGSAVFSALGCSKKTRASPPPPFFLSPPPPYWWDSCQWRMRCKWTPLLIRGDAFCILVLHTSFGFDFQSSSFVRFRAESDIPDAPANKTCKTARERERERERERVVASRFPSCGEMATLQLEHRRNSRVPAISQLWSRWPGWDDSA